MDIKGHKLMTLVFLTILTIRLINGLEGLYAGIPSADFSSHTQTQDSLAPVINEEMLQMFEAFKSRGVISSSTYLQLIGNPKLRAPETWRQVIEEYREGIAIGDDPLEHEEFVEQIPIVINEAMERDLEESSLQEGKEESPLRKDLEESPLQEDQPDIKQPTTPEQIEPTPKDEKPLPDEPVEAKPQGTPKPLDIAPRPERRSLSQSIISYHIQIAASRTPLDEEYLRSLYHGGKQIHYYQEDNWHKYYVLEFLDFENARDALKEVSVRGAFIIAFCLDKKIVAYRARQIQKIFEVTPFQKFHDDPKEQYRIQLAASIIPMSENEIKKLYPNPKDVGVIYDNYWFKYSILAGPQLEDAKQLLKAIEVKGAFIIKYRNGQQVPF